MSPWYGLHRCSLYSLVSLSGVSGWYLTAWRDEHEGCFWAVKLDVRDLGGHLDVTLRAVEFVLPPLRSLLLEPSPSGFNEFLGW